MIKYWCATCAQRTLAEKRVAGCTTYLEGGCLEPHDVFTRWRLIGTGPITGRGPTILS